MEEPGAQAGIDLTWLAGTKPLPDGKVAAMHEV